MTDSELFPVGVQSDLLPVADDRPIAFHGVNKSGSLAMSNVLRESYIREGREEQFFSTYHRKPKSLSELVYQLERSTSHGFFIGHYLYKGFDLPADGLLVTQLRHPVARTLSIHGWMKGNHIRQHGTDEGFPSLESWVRQRRSAGSQLSQFAVGFPRGWSSEPPARQAKARTALRKGPLAALTSEALLETAYENLEDDFTWYGFAEYFEESIFALAHICGLTAVSPWQRDTRNQWRDRLADTEPHVVELINETLARDVAFYERALQQFQERLEGIDFGSAFARYKERCLGQYGERLIAESPIGDRT